MTLDEIKILTDIVDMYRSEFGADTRYDKAVEILQAAQQSAQCSCSQDALMNIKTGLCVVCGLPRR